jgi:C-terminal processing protease CtpA/Prc
MVFRRGRLPRLVRAIGALAALGVAQAPALPSQSDWTFPASTSGYTGTATGLATDASGATVVVTRGDAAPGAAPPAASSTVSARLPAETLRGRRLTLRAELQTRGAGGASLWMRVDKAPGEMILLDNGVERAVRGDTESAAFVVTLPVPASATSIVFGVLLQGAGSVTAKGVRLEIGPALSPDAPIAEKAKTVLDAAIELVRKNAYMRENVNWAVAEPEVRRLAAGAEQTSDVYPAIRYVLAELRDRHSFLMAPSANAAFKTGGAENPPVEIRAADRIGYISVPGYGGGDRAAMQAYARRFHDDLGKAAGDAGCGWIVDLRTNTGGNMWPMLAGLKPFLGDATLGAFVSRESSDPWKAGQAVDVEPAGSLRRLEDAWVAVLTGPRTASSGEAVTISFKGRARTRSFGQPTAGLSTANRGLPLPDGAMIFLTVAIEADRTGKRYGEKVDPDEVIEAAPPGSTGPDATIAAATAWLRRSCSAQGLSFVTVPPRGGGGVRWHP